MWRHFINSCGEIAQLLQQIKIFTQIRQVSKNLMEYTVYYITYIVKYYVKIQHMYQQKKL